MQTYKNKKKEIRFPLGGIGTGCVSLAGNGRFCDWEIFNRPNKCSVNGYSHIAVRAEDPAGNRSARILNSDYEGCRMGEYSGVQYNGYGYGPDRRLMVGFPHFKDCTFTANFPFATLKFTDAGFPGSVSLEAFNPFIPQDSKSSCLPAAFFTVTFRNTSSVEQKFTAAFSVANPYPQGKNVGKAMYGGAGVTLTSDGKPAFSQGNGNMTLCAFGDRAGQQEYWYRGGWQDSVATYWREFSEGAELSQRHYDSPWKPGNQDTATVWAEAVVAPGKKAQVRFLLTWYHPMRENDWDPGAKDEKGNNLRFKNWYATVFRNSGGVASFCARRWKSLRRRSFAFAHAMSHATLDPSVMDAATNTLCVLKSPTVLRLEDGTLWGWEGVHEKTGSCEGTCTHVWNYAYALCFLFPDLERTMREADYKYNLLDHGMMRFRLPLPLTRERGRMLPCLDGQMGASIKTYREWKISGDTEWLKELWPMVKCGLSYAWSKDNFCRWDYEKTGVATGRQHHTLDMELFGASGWLQGFYMAALKAGAEMAEAVGDPAFAKECRELLERGQEYTEKELFNGKYYIQRVDLKDQEQLRVYGEDIARDYWNEERKELKYQIGDGCEIDQLCGQWHATLCGLGDIFSPENRRIALENLYKNNFHTSQREIYNCWRIYTLNDEAGACICSYPEGAYKPAIPIPYTEECMHGFEYALAGELIAEGMIEEGLSVVRGVRDRYDGEKRNPFNEIECGSNYARSMASFALLPLFAGFSYDMTRGEIGFAPRLSLENFQVPFGVGKAFCNVKFTKTEVSIQVLEGKLEIGRLGLPAECCRGRLYADGVEIPYRVEEGVLVFAPVAIGKTLRLAFEE